MRDYKQEYQTRGDRKRERKEPYAADSTKGSSLINPLNYKGDVLVQVWIDSRVLATLSRWMDSKGTYPRYMSQAVRRPLEVLAEFLVSNEEVEMVDSTAEARSLLERRFNVELNRGGRGEKNVIHNLALSDRRGELGERIRSERKVDDVNRPGRGNRSPMLNKAEEIYNNLAMKGKLTLFDKAGNVEGEKVVNTEETNRLANEQNNGELPPLREDATQEEIEDRMEGLKKRENNESNALDEFLKSVK